ncbi:MAG: ABC transporter ATP-binding protein [Candidatus Krumholzibacteria bacterium]|nr:ABC transporter ATP-binding protein [Candidatus Krumholzibacteria bacterium]
MSDSSGGKIYIRLLGYLKPFWRKVIILFVCTTIFASLSGISLTLIPPFLHILFGEAEQQVETESGSSVHSVPLPTFFESLKNSVITKVKEFFDPSEPLEALVRFCVVFLVLMVAKNIFGYVSTYLTIYLEQSVLYRIRNELYSAIQVLPMSFFDRQKTGHLISRITNDVSNLRGAVVGSLASIVRNSLMTLIAIFIVFLTSWKLSLLTIVLVPVNITLIGIISRKLRKGSLRAQERMADMTSVLQETISGVRVVKAFGMEDFEKGKFDLFNFRYLREYLKMRRFAELASPTSELLGILASVVILWYGGRLVIEESLDPANLMLFVGAMLWIVTPIKNLSKLNSVVQEALASGQRVLQILDIGSEDEDSGENVIDGVGEKIVYEKVSFSYNDGVEVLSGVDFEIGRGDVVAIVGPSGAGKSTIADLLPRFYRPTTGRISIDGNDIADIGLSSLRSIMGIVTQETILFNDTIFNNIAYGLSDCPLDGVIEASKAANAHSFISAMPDGYETVIGDRGVQLSGGQRQRIAIARALLKNPQILLLDEATSSLDVESEALVQEAIERLVKGRTTLVIAHRLSTIRNADKIVVVENGRIEQIGTHEELIGEAGTYRKLYHLQIKS